MFYVQGSMFNAKTGTLNVEQVFAVRLQFDPPTPYVFAFPLPPFTIFIHYTAPGIVIMSKLFIWLLKYVSKIVIIIF